ncbi:MAG: hypothetical protein RLZZ450_4673, partial [Pseudomonadota bacterium]
GGGGGPGGPAPAGPRGPPPTPIYNAIEHEPPIASPMSTTTSSKTLLPEFCDDPVVARVDDTAAGVRGEAGDWQ